MMRRRHRKLVAGALAAAIGLVLVIEFVVLVLAVLWLGGVR